LWGEHALFGKKIEHEQRAAEGESADAPAQARTAPTGANGWAVCRRTSSMKIVANAIRRARSEC